MTAKEARCITEKSVEKFLIDTLDQIKRAANTGEYSTVVELSGSPDARVIKSLEERLTQKGFRFKQVTLGWSPRIKISWKEK